jgi:hypothetical protein
MVRAVGQDSFQPKIGFKTRYGIQANPFAEAGASTAMRLSMVLELLTQTDTTEKFK